MDRTLIVCASHRGVELETQKCLVACQQRGARLVSLAGIADVALARNEVLTLALARNDSADVCLLVDDDMVFDVAAAAKLVGFARRTGNVYSGAYATKDGKLAATRFDWDGRRTDGLWMVGLGFCALPFGKLEALAQKLGTVIGPQGKQIVPFCQSAVVVPAHDQKARWCSEDYWLCRALGGVLLAPYVAAGHLKSVPLWPDDETLERLAQGVPLQWDDSPAPPASPAPSVEATPAASSSPPATPPSSPSSSSSPSPAAKPKPASKKLRSAPAKLRNKSKKPHGADQAVA